MRREVRRGSDEGGGIGEDEAVEEIREGSSRRARERLVPQGQEPRPP